MKIGAWAGVTALAAAVCLTTGCSLGYYAQSVGGHLKLLNAARPVPDWLADVPRAVEISATATMAPSASARC